METLEIENRVARAWTCFHIHEEQLLHQGTPFNKRVAILDRAVKPALMYNLETINLRKQNEELIRVTPNRMLHAMLTMKGTFESGKEYLRAKNKILQNYRTKGVITDWGLYARERERMFKWAGHVARMERHQPQRWAAKY